VAHYKKKKFNPFCYNLSMWQNRIVGHREVPPSELKAHPLNWRTHPEAQATGLRAVLDRVGIVQGIVVSKATGRILDGHLRVEAALAAGQPTVPIVEVDLSEEEERLVLATFDPLNAMADADCELLGKLLAEVKPEGEGMADLVASISRRLGVTEGGIPATVAEGAAITDPKGNQPFLAGYRYFPLIVKKERASLLEEWLRENLGADDGDGMDRGARFVEWIEKSKAGHAA
jgi:hypothetical protein